MITSNLPKKSGIYEIKNEINGRNYIGSAVNIYNRLKAHKRKLLLNKHHSIALQRAWNKYGESKFTVVILELVDNQSDLIGREQFWIDEKNSVKNGYNVSPKAGSTLGLIYSKEMLCSAYANYQGYEGFINPKGERIETVFNLEQFCKSNNLCPSTMNKLFQGKKSYHKGWTHINTVRKPRKVTNFKIFHGFINPKGQPVVIKNFLKFCRENDLDDSSLWKVMKGIYPQHKGWTYPSGGYKPKKRVTKIWYGFISPEGNQIIIENLEKFCRENGLNSGHMSKLIKGIRKSHKGWTYNPELEIL